MPDYIPIDDLADDICDKLAPLNPSRGMEDAAKQMLDAILERADEMIREEVAKAAKKAIGDRLAAHPPTLLDFIECDEVGGADVAALVSDARTLDRQLFLAEFIRKLSPMALEDLHAELMRS